jgi:hypothetical protein
MPITNPIQLFQAIVDRLDAEDWSGAAGLCDPASLSAFRRQTVEQFPPNDRTRPVTADEYMRISPDMPREMAEYNAKQSQQTSAPAARLSGDGDTNEPLELSP